MSEETLYRCVGRLKTRVSCWQTAFKDVNIYISVYWRSAWSTWEECQLSTSWQAEDAYSSRAPGLTSGLQGSINVHRGALLLVSQWQCISSFVFYIPLSQPTALLTLHRRRWKYKNLMQLIWNRFPVYRTLVQRRYVSNNLDITSHLMATSCVKKLRVRAMARRGILWKMLEVNVLTTYVCFVIEEFGSNWPVKAADGVSMYWKKLANITSFVKHLGNFSDPTENFYQNWCYTVSRKCYNGNISHGIFI